MLFRSGNANEWYQAFDCFVLPSIWEGLPVVGVEAQAADLPCVFSSAITREIGLSQHAKFVPLTESVSVWAKTLSDLLLSPVQIHRFLYNFIPVIFLADKVSCLILHFHNHFKMVTCLLQFFSQVLYI